jgi:hypothetical protein
MYFLKVNIAIALFYIFYRLVFYKDTFWATRRFYLVFSILLSVVYPFISLSGWLEKQEPMKVIMANYVQLKEITITNAPVTYLTIENVLLAVYGLVSLILFIRMVIQLSSILRLRMKGKKQILHGVEIVSIDSMITPFSFFSTIFMNPELHNEQETDQILTHENTHARQLHSLDVLLSELMTIILWINPVAWLLKYEIRHNLEFLADNSVIQSGTDSKNYQYHLLQLSYQTPDIKIINKFNVSPLKKRITMMNQQKSKKAGILKYSLIVPLALALVLSSNAETLVSSANKLISSDNKVITSNDTIKNGTTVQPELQMPVIKSAIKFTTVIKKDVDTLEVKVYEKADKMPQFPGGENELMHFIGTHLLYLIKAQENGIQGKVIVRFIVNASGEVTNAVVVKSIMKSAKKLDEVVVVGYGATKKTDDKGIVQKQIQPGTDMKPLENEAVRVISTLPDFIPGEIKGQKVPVYYTLPLTFVLE